MSSPPNFGWCLLGLPPFFNCNSAKKAPHSSGVESWKLGILGVLVNRLVRISLPILANSLSRNRNYSKRLVSMTKYGKTLKHIKTHLLVLCTVRRAKSWQSPLHCNEACIAKSAWPLEGLSQGIWTSTSPYRYKCIYIYVYRYIYIYRYIDI